MADINSVDIFFGSGIPIRNQEKECKKNDDTLDWISDDFLDSILTPYGHNSLFIDEFLKNEDIPIDPFLACNSDSGVSHGASCSPGSMKSEEDMSLSNVPHETNSLIRCNEESLEQNSTKDDVIESYNDDVSAMEFIKEEEIECEEIFEGVYIVDTDCYGMSDTYTDLCNTTSSDNSSHSAYEYTVKSPTNISQVHNEHSKVSNYSLKGRPNKRKSLDLSEETYSDDSDSTYAHLHLTPEEQKLADKEGIKLPSHYPLTKTEERELKRIRRKIRNKISAQDSRRRKKEYVDALEERVKRTSEENTKLKKRIELLENQRTSLAGQVKNLQVSLSRYSGQTTQPSTCLLVLVMSLALILAPSIQNSNTKPDSTDDESISLPDEGSTPLNSGRSRNLLFSEKTSEGISFFGDETKMLTEQLEKMQLPDGNVLSNVRDVLKFVMSDDNVDAHDYFRPKKRLATERNGEGLWAPTKMVANLVSEIQNMANTFIKNKHKNKHVANIDPIVIDLSDQ